MGEKVKCLNNVNKRMTIVAAKNYPFVRGFTSDLNIHHDEKFEPQPEEQDPHYNKIFGRKLIHNQQEFGERIQFVLQDLSGLIQLYKEFSMERDVIGQLGLDERKDHEGRLGDLPQNIKYLSSINIFDTPSAEQV